MSENSERLKDGIRDSVENKIDKLHGVVDVITGPLAPIDGVIHGTARGVLNWLTDEHPGKEECPNKGRNREGCHEGGGGPAPPAGNQTNSGTQTNSGNQTNSGTINGIQNATGGNFSGINFNKK